MKRIMKVFAITFVCLSLCGCSYFKSKMNDIKGSLIGNGYTIDTYDNYGNKVFETNGQKIKITGNKVKESSYNSDGSVKETYSLSSVITITIDGNEIESCGDTCIFEQKGLDAEVDFTKKHINSRADGITANTAIANYLNKYKNLFGKKRVVVVKSQLGQPIKAYQGDDVYWEIPDNLPKMTKLMIDGKALYIHRANFQIIDSDCLTEE